ncbi:MAG TPA: cytochrome c oxidase subunit II [Clostridia bacterium]|nr:cytochrome c oxidase subunit II [Clostridia bacterium]
MWPNLPLFPERASTLAGRVDALYFFLIAVALFFTTLIAVLILVFSIRYRKQRQLKAKQIEGSLALELTWTLIPLSIAMVMFVWGSAVFFYQARPPRGAMEIYAIGKQWMWKFQHVEGQREINELHIPVGRDVKMIMTSQDVIHSFFVPAFRVKADVLPSRYTSTWFRATTPGTYHLFCAEYCGTQHSGMIGRIVVMEPSAYEAWLGGGGTEGSLSATGQKLFQELGCATCHRSDTQGRGPNLVGAFGKPVILEDGRTVVADETYVRESILNPGAKVVSGFKPIMPTFEGQVSEEGLVSLVAYIKSLSQTQQGTQKQNEPAAPVPAGK